jgi:TPR repeat protein
MDISKKRPLARAWLGSVILSAIGLLSPLIFADFEKGMTYYEAGQLTEAVDEWTIDANGGDSDAQFNLGYMYDNGEGVPQDAKKAVYWYTLSAEQGDSNAQRKLGLMYANGEGVPQDAKKAAYWFTLSAEQGDSNAQYNLGIMYIYGQGIEPNFELAYMWANLAAANGADPDVRDGAAEELNSEQLARAQKMSSDWAAAHP